MSDMIFRITNITCEACVKLSTIALKKINGVGQVLIDMSTGVVRLQSDRDISVDEITSALKSVGKDVLFQDNH